VSYALALVAADSTAGSRCGAEPGWSRCGAGPDAVRPDLLAWAQEVDVSRLSDRSVHRAEDYLRRYRRMNLGARQEEAFRLLAAIQAQVSPPPTGIHPMDVIATVLAVRRQQLGIG
jgi:hypothetical protein